MWLFAELIFLPLSESFAKELSGRVTPIVAVAFILGAIAVQHPFNACLGPSWKQDRMLMLAAECGFLSMIPVAFMSIAYLSTSAAIVSLIVSVAGWLYSYTQYLGLSRRDAAMWLDANPIKEPEGH